MLGVTRRGAMWTALKGDILMSIARNLPESVGLLIVGRTGRLGENLAMETKSEAQIGH
jgi:hypothetical protein